MLLPIIIACSWLMLGIQVAGICAVARAGDEHPDAEET
jgi:hypothetical protein